MRCPRLLSLAVPVAAASAALAGSPAVADPAAGTGRPADTYYLSLGDSLAAGYQPDTDRDEPVSYSDDLYATLRQSDPNLKFVRLGCSGETTETMISGGRCTYPGASSQLAYATQFLREHPGQVRYVTEDIGANDIYHCLRDSTGSAGSSGVPDIGCVTQSLGTIGGNLTTINGQLREAGGEGPRYVGMNYYDPALAGWVDGGAGRATAAATAAAANVLSATIAGANSAVGWQTADVAGAFFNNDFGNPVDVPGFGSLPRNVASICTWTWMCTDQDIHANPTGHRVIAQAFLPLLTAAPAPGTASAGAS